MNINNFYTNIKFKAQGSNNSKYTSVTAQSKKYKTALSEFKQEQNFWISKGLIDDYAFRQIQIEKIPPQRLVLLKDFFDELTSVEKFTRQSPLNRETRDFKKAYDLDGNLGNLASRMKLSLFTVPKEQQQNYINFNLVSFSKVIETQLKISGGNMRAAARKFFEDIEFLAQSNEIRGKITNSAADYTKLKVAEALASKN